MSVRLDTWYNIIVRSLIKRLKMSRSFKDIRQACGWQTLKTIRFLCFIVSKFEQGVHKE